MTRGKITTLTMTITDKQSNRLEEDQEALDYEEREPFLIQGKVRLELVKKAAISS